MKLLPASCFSLIPAGLVSGLILLAASQVGATEISMRDWTGRGFVPDKVTYEISRQQAEQAWHVVDEQGLAAAVQISSGADRESATLSFIASIPANGTSTYRLVSGPLRTKAKSSVEVTADGKSQVFSNGLFSVRVPADQVNDYPEGIALGELPAPILGFQHAGSKAWLGASEWVGDAKVKSFKVSTEAKGPVYAELLYRIDFLDGGFYEARISVTDQVPLVEVREDFDRQVRGLEDFWALNMSRGWKPDSVETTQVFGQGIGPVRYQPLADHVDKPVTVGMGQSLKTTTTNPGVLENEVQIAGIVPDSCWGSYVAYFNLYDKAGREADATAYPIVGMTPLHKGNWRRPNTIPVVSQPDGSVVMRLPVGMRPTSWTTEPSSDYSPFSMNEHDPDLPATYGRRHWGLLLSVPGNAGSGGEAGRLADPGFAARNFFGTVGLDRYKDFILEWPDQKITYPRVLIQPDQIPEYRKAAESLPANLQQILAKTYWFTGDATKAQSELASMNKQLDYMTLYTMSSLAIAHHHTYRNAEIISGADSVMSWPELDAEERKSIRARLALLAYLMQEPDVMSAANGTHHGNPNMGTARQMDLANFVAMLPDHPDFKNWSDYASRFTQYKTETQMAPGGSWFEYGVSYHMHGYAKIMRAMMGLQAMDVENLTLMRTYNHQTFAYLMNLLTPPDPRWRTRIVPGLADSPPGMATEFLSSTGTFSNYDEPFAANMRWAWDNNGQLSDGASSIGNPAMARPWISAQEPELTSHVYPGFGVIFRSNPGENETYLLLRSGFNWSHWPQDQGHVVLYSEGAPLITPQSFQYFDKNFSKANPEFFRNNGLRFGHPENDYPHAWPDSNVLETAFGDSAEYAWSSTGFPAWFLNPGYSNPAFGGPRKRADGNQKEGAFQWDRQVLFLKGRTPGEAGYFVFNDTTRGKGQLTPHFNLNLLGTESDHTIKSNRLLHQSEWGPDLSIVFPDRSSLAFSTNEMKRNFSYGQNAKITATKPGEILSRNWFGKDDAPASLPDNPPASEQVTQFRLDGAPGEGFFWVAFPQKEGAKAPTVTRLAPGAVKIEHPQGTDYVFLSREQIRYEGEGVTFEGLAGVVRLSSDRKTPPALALLSGQGKVGYQSLLLSGRAPLEKLGETATAFASTEALPLEPKLTTHSPLVDGIQFAQEGGVTEYVVASPVPVTFGKDHHKRAGDGHALLLASPVPVTLGKGHLYFEATRALVQVEGEQIRIVVPDRSYAHISIGSVGVRGMGPFDLTWTDDGIRGEVTGETRTLVSTTPKNILRPMSRLNGTRWYAGYADEPTIWHNDQGRIPSETPEFTLAFGVLDGRQKVEISEWTYEKPAIPPARITIK